MANQYFHKPENALKRANELRAVGNSQAALQVLHDVLLAKKSRTWTSTSETIMFKYVDLCVDLQTHRHAKDGLHQYRNIAQQQAPNSLENVINYLLEKAENECTKVAASAKSTSSKSVADLDNMTTPESIMLSTMSDGDENERAERELLVPWLKFCWETYRSVLDILKTNSKLEKLYHATSVRAFEFCRKYDRRTELRRLCEMLRQHLSNLQKASANNNTSRLRGWEGWTHDGVEMQLSTRFSQLEAASALELWTEGFRTVEDIYAIARISKKAPKPKLMARYYERLTKIFWVSDNLLFHAYAWWRHLSLTRESSKPVAPEERELRACAVVLAALAIPDKAGLGRGLLGDEEVEKGEKTDFSLLGEQQQLGSGAVPGGAAMMPATNMTMMGLSGTAQSAASADDEIEAEKNARMATLLGFASHPSRKALLAEVEHAGLLEQSLPCVRALHAALESTFDPLQLAGTLKPLFEELRAIPRLAQYAGPLERLAASRIIRQLSVVYRSMELDKFKSLLSELGGLEYADVEKLVVGAGGENATGSSAAASGAACARLDYRANCLRFAETPSRAETRAKRGAESSIAMTAKKTTYFGVDAARASHDAAEAALDELRRHLSSAQKAADLSDKRDKQLTKTEQQISKREAFFAQCKKQSEAEHDRALQRKSVIERRKEEHERMLTEKAKAEAEERRKLEEGRKRDEEKRLDREARDREKEKVVKMKAELALQEAREVMKSLGQTVNDGDEFTDISQIERERVIEETKQAAIAKRKAEEQRLGEQAKRLDYICRSLRLEELPVLKERHESQLERDRAEHDLTYRRSVEEGRKRHTADLAEKARLAPLQKFKSSFSQTESEKRASLYVEKQNAAREAFAEEKFARKVARARRRLEEAEEEAERKANEEEEARERAIEEERIAEEEIRDEQIRKEQEAEAEQYQLEENKRRSENEANAKAEFEKNKAEKAKLDAERAQQRAEDQAARQKSQAAEAEAAATWRRGAPAAPPAAAPAASSRITDDGGNWRRGGASEAAPPPPRQRDAAPPPRRGGGFGGGAGDSGGGGDDGGKWKRGGASAAPGGATPPAARPPPATAARTERPKDKDGRADKGSWR